MDVVKGQRLPREVRIKQVEDCFSSGLSVKEWCRQNNVSAKTIYYWKSSPNKAEVSADWVDLSKATQTPCTALALTDNVAPLVVKAGVFSIEMTEQVDEDLLADVFGVVARLC